MTHLFHILATAWPNIPDRVPNGMPSLKPTLWCLLFALVAAATAAALVWWRWKDQRRDGAAVRALARVAGLSPAQRRLVQRIAEVGGFHSAGPLLVSRGCFDRAVARCADRDTFGRRLSTIRGKLFGRGDEMTR